MNIPAGEILMHTTCLLSKQAFFLKLNDIWFIFSENLVLLEMSQISTWTYNKASLKEI